MSWFPPIIYQAITHLPRFRTQTNLGSTKDSSVHIPRLPRRIRGRVTKTQVFTRLPTRPNPDALPWKILTQSSHGRQIRSQPVVAHLPLTVHVSLPVRSSWRTLVLLNEGNPLDTFSRWSHVVILLFMGTPNAVKAVYSLMGAFFTPAVRDILFGIKEQIVAHKNIPSHSV